MSGKLFIITGPSGVGKTAVVERLLVSIAGAHRVISCTSRGARQGEVDGVDYHFLTRENFQAAIDQGEMFEWDEHYGNLYGIRASDVERDLALPGPTIITTDTAGAKTLKDRYGDQAMVIFLTAPKDTLERRIRGRGAVSEADVQTRLNRLPEELAFGQTADAIVENVEGQLEQTVVKISIVVTETFAKLDEMSVRGEATLWDVRHLYVEGVAGTRKPAGREFCDSLRQELTK